jgi:hypothetical protein
LCLAILLFCSVAVRLQSSVYGDDDVAAKISEAESAVGQAFVAVLDAERAGANVSGLVVKLHEAGVFLAGANVAFRAGDYVNASLLAKQCLDFVDGVAADADVLKGQAESESQNRLFLTAALSSVGLSVLFVAGLFVWRFLKGRYVRRVLGMKPEKVVEG